MKKIYLIVVVTLFSIVTYAQHSVTLKVVDYQNGELTNDTDDLDNDHANVIVFASDMSDTHLYNHGNWWYAMYTGETDPLSPNGKLTKSEGVWTWQATFSVSPGEYKWNPHFKSSGWMPINESYPYAAVADLFFTVATDGTVVGTTTLNLPIGDAGDSGDDLGDDSGQEGGQGYSVTPYVTTGTKSKLLEAQTPISFSTNQGSATTTLTVNSSQQYQTMDGFGLCMTQGSAEAIMSLTPAKQEQLLNDLFHPILGIGSSMVRISIAASDLSSSSYSYNETNGDVQMNNFSLDGPDKDFLIPILKRALVINPDLKFLATPWTAPRWMKTNNGWVGGRLKTEYYEAYANYFVKYFQAMEAEGINIWGITPQNEPENPNNEPSLSMNSTEQKNFINNNLGPAMVSAGYAHIKIIAFDHNCDNTAYPIDVLNNSTYVDGAAFHLYLGDISAMSTVKNATNKNVYFTEQYTGSGGDFSGDFGWHMESVGIGSINNWSKTVIEWNVATDEFFGPRTPGGCTTCQGAFTVNNSSNYTTNVSYYIVGQFSKFVKDGATRIGLSGANSNVAATAFQNPDGSFAVVAYNTSGIGQSVKIEKGGEGIVYNIPRKSAATFVWREGPVVPVESIAISPASGTLEEGQTIKPALVFTPENSTNKGAQWSSDNLSVAMVSGDGTVTAMGEGQTVVRARSVDGDFVASYNIIVTPKPIVTYSGFYNIVSVYSSKGIEVASSSINSKANVQQMTLADESDNQLWKIEHVENNVYLIRAKHSDMCLSTGADGQWGGKNVEQQTCNNSNSQKWTIDAVAPDIYKILNVDNGEAIDVQDVSMADGANIQTWTFEGNDHPNQLWQLKKIVGTGMDGSLFSEQLISLYPNPVDDLFILEYIGGAIIVGCQIISLIMKKLRISTRNNCTIYRKLFSPLVCTFLFFSSAQLNAEIFYVSPVSQGSGNGSSWANASSNLGTIINQTVEGDKIFLKSGTYTSTHFGVANALNSSLFIGKKIELYGGFNGESAPERRSLNSNMPWDFKHPTIFQGSMNKRVLELTTGALIDGVTITGGSVAEDGGGIYLTGSFARNCIIEGNKAKTGGGAFIRNDDSQTIFSQLSYSLILNNSSFAV